MLYGNGIWSLVGNWIYYTVNARFSTAALIKFCNLLVRHLSRAALNQEQMIQTSWSRKFLERENEKLVWLFQRNSKLWRRSTDWRKYWTSSFRLAKKNTHTLRFTLWDTHTLRLWMEKSFKKFCWFIFFEGAALNREWI